MAALPPTLTSTRDDEAFKATLIRDVEVARQDRDPIGLPALLRRKRCRLNVGVGDRFGRVAAPDNVPGCVLGDVAAAHHVQVDDENRGRWGAADGDELDLLELAPPKPRLLNLARPQFWCVEGAAQL